MRFVAVLPVLFLVVLSATVDFKSYSNYKVVQVQGDNDALVELQNDFKSYSGSVFFTFNKGGLNTLVAPELLMEVLEAADNLGLTYDVIIEDFSESLGHERRKRSDEEFSFSAYHTVSEIHAYLRSLNKKYPFVTRLTKIGKSYEGRDLLGIRINTGSSSNKPAIMLEAGIHAREWIAPAVATYFINQLLTSTDADVISMRNNFDWHIFPTVNPDGYQYSIDYDRMWRKTRSKSANGCYGADGNRNWDHNWGVNNTSTDPCEYEVYGGTGSFSEVETRSLANYARRLTNLKMYIALHAYYPLLLVPYGNSADRVSNYDDLVQIGSKALDYGMKVNSSRYYGPNNGPEIIYGSSGNAMDWIYETLGVPLAFNFEMRGDNFMWPASRISEQGDEMTQIILGLTTEAKALNYV